MVEMINASLQHLAELLRHRVDGYRDIAILSLNNPSSRTLDGDYVLLHRCNLLVERRFHINLW